MDDCLPPTVAEMVLVHGLDRDVLTGRAMRRALGIRRPDLDGQSHVQPPGPVRESFISYRDVFEEATGFGVQATTRPPETEMTDIRIADSSKGDTHADGPAASIADDRVQTSVTSVEQNSAAEDASVGVTSGSNRARGTVLWSESVRSDVACHLHQLEGAYRAERLPGSFLELAVEEFFDTWALSLGRSDVWEHVARNYRYRCTSPVCDSRNVTLHHIVYRAHGGDDDDDNLTTPCDFCHLDGEHGGRLRILPPASRPTFLLGNPPVLVVQGREVVAA